MITRAPDHCSLWERYSTAVFTDPATKDIPASMKVPDMPCIQYLQYQSTGANANGPMSGAPYDFVDLFQPDEDLALPSAAILNKIHTYGFDASGNRVVISGTGSDQFTDKPQKVKTGFMSFNDITKKYFKTAAAAALFAKDPVKNASQATPAAELSTATVFLNSLNQSAVGEKIMNASNTTQLKGLQIRMEKDTAVGVQFPGLVANSSTDNTAYCAIFSTKPEFDGPFFIPTNSKNELNAFLLSAYANNVPGILARPCTGVYQTYQHRLNNPAAVNLNKTSTWIGNLRCSELIDKPACNQTKMITAFRYCLLENNSIGGCGNCMNALDPDKDKKDAIGLLVSSDPKEVGGEVLSQTKCFFQAACHASSLTGCPSANTSGGHVFCLAPETKIAMADGTEKAIIDIKLGDEVKSFDGKHSKNVKLKKATVKATAITDDQEIIDIDGLKITPKHKIVLESGRGVMAQDVRVGDNIVKADGKIMTVQKIDHNLPKIKVYNLVLDKKSDGYIANGLRVLSYPLKSAKEK
jgi:hypothetical protein